MVERVRSFSHRLVSLAIAGALLVGLSGAGLAADDLRIEAEEFRECGYWNIGGENIRESYCSYASGGLAVDGFGFG